MCESTTTAINIDPQSGNGRYLDVLEACDELKDVHGSRVNALANMVRQSPLFHEATKRLKDRNNGNGDTTQEA
ncbi:MAG: hypothetical protein IIC33_07030 [Chloroflexi bacterium]|nr:hypothetical protein [Chloroflexota bacterium]